MKRTDTLKQICSISNDESTVGEAIDIIKGIIAEHKQEGFKEFSGGYIQYQQNKNILVLMYGYGKSNNSFSVKLDIEDDETDYIYYALKAYLLSTRKRNKKLKIGLVAKGISHDWYKINNQKGWGI